ncbi:CHRD domain-containing protein [Paenibacillus sp. 1011MAR3C5]|uniref:CHRD domain-containing protein n=1 Tax=Paenibacillus sp. 1011MAR3C5 TaxID=1675787 RepID=UPI000E6B57F1|nr:CHRD domain-containing protein [Paenibacillus sp. 1011MAR3C5]RJE84349.1 CHRD domain-containing protein [Paenibacillus sp. 1011MAR3C5]
MATFRAFLRGRNEVPPVRTNASGNVIIREIDRRNGNGRSGDENNGGDRNNGNRRRRNRRLRFRLSLRNIRRVTAAHIHLGRPGENGPVVAFLFGPNNQGVSFRRGVITGTLRDSDLVGPLAGSSIRRLIREIERGNAYVNVHTRQNPDGEIRGQLR